MAFIDKEKLLHETDGGREIIERWVPESAASFNNPNRKFKLRTEEKTASASVKRMPDGNWVITDFGGDAKPMNAINLVMHLENMDFTTALNLIAAEMGFMPDEDRANIIKPDIRQETATAEQIDGTWTFVKSEGFTTKQLRTFIAPKVWEWLISRCKDVPAEKQEEKAIKEVSKVLKRYNFFALDSYTVIKERKATTIRATEHFPMFMFDEGDWQKIYKPKEVLAANRFIYYVPAENKERVKLREYLFGAEQMEAAYDEVVKVEQELAEIDLSEASEGLIGSGGKKNKKKAPDKLEYVFMCSGGSDALNLAIIGQCFRDEDNMQEWYWPLWMNSETANLSIGSAKRIFAKTRNFINIPDIDATGLKQAHKLATEHLELKTLYLPEELKQTTDTFRSKPLKDLRDYFKAHSVYDFQTLLKTACPYRFWDAIPPTERNPKWTYKVNNRYLYNFLARNGFYRYENEAEKDGYIYIRIEGHIVRKIEPKKIRDFVNQFIERRNPDVELMNTFLRTNQLNETSLSNLPFIKIDFTDFDKTSQWMFFNNGMACITAQGITWHKPGSVNKYVWDNEVIKHNVKLLPDFFTAIEYCEIESREKRITIDIHNQECLIFRYLINTSRLLWREELENRLDGIPEKERDEYAALHRFTKDELHLMDGKPAAEREAYRLENKWNIAGPLLTEREQAEQRLHLLNKLYALGYVFHRNKENGKEWAIWGMDAKLSEGDESHGGTGKSLLPSLINNHKLINTEYREGRNSKLTDNAHIWEGIDKHTDLVLIDDCNRYMKFDFFFSSITGPLRVNPKTNKQYTIDFIDAPKFWFTSNFPPYNADISTERRLLYLIYSDYYHFNRMNEYREDRTVRDDFGISLGTDFNEHQWNLFLNLIMQSVKFFLMRGEKLNPPMENVHRRNLKNQMGEAFEAWADVYFSPESGLLNNKVVKQDAMRDWITATNPKTRTSQHFTTLLKAWCRFNGYELNPRDMHNDRKNHRIIDRIKEPEIPGVETKSKPMEMLYIRTPDKQPDAAIVITEQNELSPI